MARRAKLTIEDREILVTLEGAGIAWGYPEGFINRLSTEDKRFIVDFYRRHMDAETAVDMAYHMGA